MLSPSEQLLYSATRIKTFKEGRPVQTGTGFWWRTVVQGGTAVTLVTNKHVLSGADAVNITFHVANSTRDGPSGVTETATILLHAGGIVNHPDPDVDLCAISAGGFQQWSKSTGKNIFQVGLDASLIPDSDGWNDLDALEEIIMIGCPNGLFDEKNGLPISRRGITASHPGFQYNGNDQFLIDIAAFPGSSGSPVLLYSSGTSYDKGSGNFSLGVRIKLLGVLFAGPTIDQSGRIILATVPKIEVTSMMHLGYVLRATRLIEMDEIIRVRAVPAPS